jgi:voltage-gated potassium channel
MAERLYKIRYSIFLFSFLLVLFGDILISQEWVKLAQTVLILQNMILSLILFMRANELKRMALVLLLTFGAFFSICVYLIPGFSSYPFLIVYWIYFLFVSYQIYYDLMYEKKLGIETISAAFCGFILLGTVFSLLFVSMGSEGAFKGPQGTVSNPDYLYFSFVTLLNNRVW